MNREEKKNKYISTVLPLVEKVPQVVSLEVTTRCNLDCVYCTRDKINVEDLALDKIEILRERLIGVEQLFICGIGESFCYPHIYEAIWALKDFRISIITNGTVPIDFEKLTREKNVEALIFSIDAFSQEKMETICRGFNYNGLVKNLTEAKKYPKLIRSINTTVNSYNVNELPNVILFAAKHKIMVVNFQLQFDDEQFIEESKDLIAQKIEESKKVALHYGIFFNPFYRLTCHKDKSLISNVRINGDVFSCCFGMNQNTLLGNIYEQAFAEIWEEQGRPTLHDGTYCGKCNLVTNLIQIEGA